MAPDEYKTSWPTVGEAHVARYDKGPARKLDSEEVLALVGETKRKPTLFDERMWSETLSELIEKYSSRHGYAYECAPSATGQSHIFRTPVDTFQVPDAFIWEGKKTLITARKAVN
ncbi:MAG: hypothetical protein HGA38_02330 [Candidatus Moranbacteria bacterium]|nr:hypothetical protein [Candidatus Moranbacteria bacterium]